MSSRENWLCNQLDNCDLNDEVRARYDKELDDIANRRTIQQAKQKKEKQEEAIKFAEFKARILAEDQDFIQAIGEEEFGDDYELCQEGASFVVYSKVASPFQDNRRVHDTLESAEKDRRYLFYNRLYSKYVRPGEVSKLLELTL